MTAESELMQKRQEVQDEILALKDQIPTARILNRLGGAFKQNSLGYWLSNIILLNLIVLSPWGVIGFVLKEFVMPSTVVVQSLLATLGGIFFFIGVHLVFRTISSDIAHQIVGKINTTDDLSRILVWSKQSWSIQKLLPVIVMIGIFWALVGTVDVSLISRQFVGLGFLFTSFLVGLLFGVVMYIYLWMCLLISSLKVYQYEINAFSPADSEIVGNILKVAMKGIYILAGYGAVGALIMTSNTKKFDLKSVTTLFSQLMLPLLGLLLGNIDKVLELLRK